MPDNPTRDSKPSSNEPADNSPGEPPIAGASPTDSPRAGASSAPEGPSRKGSPPSSPDAPAAAPAVTGEAGSATGEPVAPAGASKPAAPKRPAAAAKPTAGAGGEHTPKATPPSGPPDPPPPAGATPPAFIASLEAAIPGSVSAVSYWVGDWTVIVPAARILDVARHLRDEAGGAFDLCSDLTAIDWPLRAERFDVVYCLYSTRHRHRLRVKLRVADQQPVRSVTGIWPAANWLEREVFDMFGISFTDHPDPRRILMPDDWQGHPERKDYPLEGPGEMLMENPIDWLKLRQAKEEAEIE